MRQKVLYGWLLCYAFCASANLVAQTSRQHPISLFSLDRVKLLESPFKHAQDLNKAYLISLDADRLLSPFLREAGLISNAESYTNWENTGLDGHIGGHYLTALSLMYASTKDVAIKDRLDYMIATLKRCQDKVGTGYIGGVPGSMKLWEEIQSGNIAAGNFDLNKAWVPLYNIHKTYAGLRDAYVIARHPDAKEMLVKMTDWSIRLVQDLSEEQIQDMLRSEHGGLNEVFADVAVITGDERYLRLAKQFTHQSFLEPLLHHEDRLTGMHANTQIPKIIGVKRIADIEGEESWESAARFFWETVVKNRSVAIGGNSAYEHFHPINDFSNMINSVEGPETCNTYNMLKLSAQLFQTEGDVRYVDYYERALYNHILSTQHPDHGGFVYFTPMRPGHYRVYSQPQTSFWCCVGSGLENHSKYGEFIYAHRQNDLWVNLFIPSILDWEEKQVKIEQQTSFPEEAATRLLIQPDKPIRFAIKLRYPSWVRPDELTVSVNGKRQRVKENPGQFVTIDRKWKKGDVVEMVFAMPTGVEQIADGSNHYAFTYGPIVLASKTDANRMDGLLADDSRGGHIAKGPQVPLQDIPFVIGERSALQDLPEKVSAKELRFALNSTYHGMGDAKQELVPFYQIHDSRYIVYWPQAETKELAEERLSHVGNIFATKLDSLTLDRVHAGQQQPESDHGVEFDNSITGVEDGIQWREASGWFSYGLDNSGKDARYLYLRYFDKGRSSDFEIFLEGKLLAEVKLTGDKKTMSYQIFEIPREFRDREKLTFRSVASGNSVTAKITEVRLLSGNIEEVSVN